MDRCNIGSGPVTREFSCSHGHVEYFCEWISSAASVRILPGMVSGAHDFEGLILQSAL